MRTSPLVTEKELTPHPDATIANARIESTFLGVEDHGIFTFNLMLDYGGSGQGFGSYGLDAWEELAGRRVGTAYGLEMIKAVLQVVGVEKWEDLEGQLVRARQTHSSVSAIGRAPQRVAGPEDPVRADGEGRRPTVSYTKEEREADVQADRDADLSRIADALEKIASALENYLPALGDLGGIAAALEEEEGKR